MALNDILDPVVENETCPAVGYQSATVCVPVTVAPFAKTGTTHTKCCGTPVVKSGDKVCGGTPKGTCVFTISQDICVSVPVDFGATATVGDTYVDCKGASARNICTDCSKPDDEEEPDTPDPVV